ARAGGRNLRLRLTTDGGADGSPERRPDDEPHSRPDDGAIGAARGGPDPGADGGAVAGAAARRCRSQPPTAATHDKPIIRFERTGKQTDLYTLTIQEADIRQVLEMFAELSGRNIVVGRSVTGTVSASLNGVNIDEALSAILRSQGLVYEEDEKFIFVATPEDADSIKHIESKITTRIYRPKYINGTDLQTLLTPLMSPDVGKMAITTPATTGLESDNSDGGGDQLTQQDAVLVLDYPQVIAEMDKVVEEMDVPPSQVVIEAMILTVNLSDDLQFGVNFALLSDHGKGLAVSGDGSVLNNATGFPPQGNGSGSSIVPAAGDFIAKTSGLKFGLISGDVTSFVEALESISDTNLIASPQLRVINKQKAELIIGSRLGYSTVTNNGTTSIQNVSFLDVGTKLILRPFISPDGMVRMEIHPERSSGQINDSTGLPDTQTTEVTTNVMVRDGTTVVIGGLIDEQTKEEIQRIPLLGSLPLIGPVFQNKSENVVRTEMIVLITPRIVPTDEAATAGQAAKTEFEQRADRFNSELSPINRNNLTRLHLERAQFYLDRGAYDRAQTHAREAVHLNKNNKAALAMLQHIEQMSPLTNKKWWRWGFATQEDTLPPPLIRLRNYSLNDDTVTSTNVPLLHPVEHSPDVISPPLAPDLEPLIAPPPPKPTEEAMRSSGAR
ncbi:MAG: secretin and TonB N-terminal domain-containing protein, partial [Planctomycetaceae bacterium]